MGSLINKLLHKLIRTKGVDADGLLEKLIGQKERDEHAFYTSNVRPFVTDGFDIPGAGRYKQPAIVMQGPINSSEDLTYETLKLYARLTDPKLVILSTWEAEDAGQLKQIADLGITIVQNKMPAFSGNQNINLQISSTAAGIKKAIELGAEHVLKTRTDQRIYAASALHLFYNLQDTFPLADTTQQKQRLIITSLGTLKYRLYGAGDMLMFGHVDDMLKYWDTDHDDRQLELQPPENYSIKEFSKLRLGEMYLCSKYFEKLGYTLDWTLKQSWDLLAKHFCVTDHQSLDLFWPKYDRRNEFRFKYYAAHSLQNLTFADWLELHFNKLGYYPEEYLNSPFSKAISK